MGSSDLREKFLGYFEANGHLRLPSAPMVPLDDPSILFVVAGMVPLKPYFLGVQKPPNQRLTSIQKCFRTVDIERVGYTPRHLTFFQMMGNFSIGDYFKEDAIAHAWELLTKKYGLPKESLAITTHPGDDDAVKYWKKVAGVAESEITKLDDNFWEAGPTGPCGYDSEVHWDSGGPCSCGRKDCPPGCDGDRWIEIWNLVFMEFDRDESGTMNPLPKPCIDTGSGLERTACALDGKKSVFDTELFVPLIEGFAARSNQPSPESLNVLADHIRAATFLIADGVSPANDGRGYVLRRVIRRAGLHARRLQLQGGLAKGVDDVVAMMGKDYPDLVERKVFITETLAREEEIFARTLEEGISRLEALFTEEPHTLSGDSAFRLYDTYGMPVELTVELAQERGISVDMAGFSRAMDGQRARSKASSKVISMERGVELAATEFVGYESLESDATVSRIGIPDEVEKLSVGDENTVIFEPTPFYAEAGGQIGDTGTLEWEGGKAVVIDTVYVPGTKARAHRVKVEKGTLERGNAVHARVDGDRRGQIIRHHSATHLLHRALRETLGETAVQKGSYVGPAYTTFDFAFGRALTDDEVTKVERLINHAIQQNLAKKTTVMSLEDAKKTGAMALFGEKYGDSVRVVEFGDWSRELCGGIHVEHTGDIGAAIVVSESSVGQGVRRIEMMVGPAAVEHWQKMKTNLTGASQALKVPAQELVPRVEALQDQVRKLTKQLEEAKAGSGNLLDGASVERVGNLQFASLLLDGRPDAAELVPIALDRLFAERIGGDGVACVFGADAVAIKVGRKWVDAGVSAGDLVSAACQVAGGKGGGRPDFARGGIANPAKVPEALVAVKSKLSKRL